MKIKLLVTAVIVLNINVAALLAEEVSLLDSSGQAVAYIVTNDQLTIRLWSGEAVAYLYNSSVYGWNGMHLGWFSNGLLRDNEGFVVGGFRGAIPVTPKAKRAKGAKRAKRAKGARSARPARPAFRNSWSPIPLSVFLAQGST